MIPYLERLGFDVVGYGCMTCIGNSGPIDDNIANTIEKVSLLHHTWHYDTQDLSTPRGPLNEPTKDDR